MESVEEAEKFYEERFAGRKYALAICRKEDVCPIGYVNADTGDGHDFGYALRREFWRRGIAAEAGRALIERLREDGVPYITATHDRNNPGSGGVMRRLGMKYCYSYEELWQPKNILVTFRMYQLNLDGREDRVCRKYWDDYSVHFIEEDVCPGAGRAGKKSAENSSPPSAGELLKGSVSE